MLPPPPFQRIYLIPVFLSGPKTNVSENAISPELYPLSNVG